MRNLFILMLAALALHPTTGSTQPVTLKANPSTAYAPYEFLIGDWSSSVGGGAKIRQSFRWGPDHAYILYSTYLAEAGEPQRLHFEGVMAWNGRSNALDYVFAVEPGSGAQEKGTISAQADGSVVREVELTNAKGEVGHFRQTFRRTGPNSAVTSLMRRTETGWEPNFPGSDNVEMERLPS